MKTTIHVETYPSPILSTLSICLWMSCRNTAVLGLAIRYNPPRVAVDSTFGRCFSKSSHHVS